MNLLNEIPKPPSNKTGWPWTEETLPLPPTAPNGSSWPKVSIVTPSYNQGQFLEETIRSVLLQNYPNMEYIIMDGGSTDNSVEIIKKYEPWLTYWESIDDRGQSHAINKGWIKSNGDILAWINSDDFYYPNALNSVVSSFLNQSNIDVIYGACNVVDKEGMPIEKYIEWNFSFLELIDSWASKIPQPSTFIKRDALLAVNLLNEKLHFAMDYDLWIKLGLKYSFHRLPETLSVWRYYSDAKSIKQRHLTIWEAIQIYFNMSKDKSIPPNYRRLAKKKGYLLGIKLIREQILKALKRFFSYSMKQN